MKSAVRIAGALAVIGAGCLGGAANASASTTVTPKPVTFIDACGTDKDTYIIPNVTGVDYFANGVKLNPGVRQVDKNDNYVQVFTMAQNGYELSSSATWDHQFDATSGCQKAAPKPTAKPSTSASSTSSTAAPAPSSTEFKNCDEAAAAGRAPIQSGEPGYSSKLDKNGNGVACETDESSQSVTAPQQTDSASAPTQSSAPKTSADALPHTGIDAGLPLATAAAFGLAGVALVGGGIVATKRRN